MKVVIIPFTIRYPIDVGYHTIKYSMTMGYRKITSSRRKAHINLSDDNVMVMARGKGRYVEMG